MNSSSKGKQPYPTDPQGRGYSYGGINPSNAQKTEAFPTFDPTVTSNESYDINTGRSGFAHYAGNDQNALNRLIAASSRFSPPQPELGYKQYNVGAQYRIVGDVRNAVAPALPRQFSQVPSAGFNGNVVPSISNHFLQTPTFGFNAHSAAFVPVASPARSSPGMFNANTPAFVPGGSPAPLLHSSSSSSLVQASNNGFAFRSKPPVAPRAMIQSLLESIKPDPYNQQNGNTGGALVPSGPPPIRHFTTRFDKKLKDIVITHEGVFYNAVRVEQQIFADGTIETETFHDFDLENGYNLLEELTNMSPEERAKFFSDKFAEIVIDGPYVEALFEGPVAFAKYLKENKKVDTSAAADIFGTIGLGLGLRTQTSTKGKEEEIATQPKTVLDILALLGPDFPQNCRNLFIRIIFPPDSAPAQAPVTHPVIFHSALAQKQSARPNAGAIDCGTTPLLWHLTCLVDPLNTFTNLRRLDVTLQTPKGCPRPVTLEHMDHILPFYDIESFLGWQVWWTHEYLTHPERVQAWPLEQCACEWVKICAQRDQWWEQIEGAVFVRKSQFHGPGKQFGGGGGGGGGGGRGGRKYGGPHSGGVPKRGRYR